MNIRAIELSRGRHMAVLLVSGLLLSRPGLAEDQTGTQQSIPGDETERCTEVSCIVAMDPNDPVYAKLDSWICAGLIDEPFMLRPYSPEIIAQMLKSVVARGSAGERKEAAALLAALESGYVQLGANTEAKGLVSSGDSSEYLGTAALTLRLNAKLGEGLWISGSTGMTFSDQTDADAIVRLSVPGERPQIDLINDGGVLHIAGFNGNELACRLYALSNAGYSHGSFWTQSGITRSSYGPFFENGIVIGPQAPAAPNWSAHARFGSWRYSMQLMNLTKSAVSAGASTGGPSVDVDRGSDKFMMFHSFSCSPAAGLDLGIFETVVWANRFEPIYILPFANYFSIQSLTDFNDNSLAGVYGTMRLPGRVLAKAQIYIDDIDFNSYENFDFDSKLLAAGEAGIDWAPPGGVLKMLSANYTAVTPYMYTHKYDGTAQDDYTDDGCCIGAELLPNSDRVEIKARLVPSRLPAMKIEGLARLIRHGNASGQYGGSGGLFDDGWSGSVCTYETSYDSTSVPKYFRFLSQTVIERTWEIGAGSDWRLDMGRLSIAGRELGEKSLDLSVRYVFAIIENAGLVSGYTETENYISFGAQIWL